MVAVSLASAFLTRVQEIHDVMPTAFTAVEVEGITMLGPFQVGFSTPVATRFTQMVSSNSNKGKLVMDLEVSWVSRRV